MSWSAPRTFAVSDKITAAMMNAHVRDNLVALYSAIGPTSVPGMMTQYIWCTLGGTDGHRPVVGGVANESWHLCNGDANIDGSGITAPDWTDRIIIGAGDTYAQSATGGAATKDLSHTHDVGSLATAAKDIVDHVHLIAGTTATATGSTTVTSPITSLSSITAHTHAVSGNTNNPAAAATHTHTVSGASASGGSATQDILPPYHALYGFVFVGV